MPTNIKSKKPQQKPNQPKLNQPKLNQPKLNQPKPKRSTKESDGESVKTQNTGTNVSIQISDCEITHPNMPSSSSLENLIPKKSPAKKGFTNPSFSIDTVSSDDSILGMTSSTNTTDVAAVGTLPFRGARRGSYNSDGASIRKLNLAQQRRGSYTSSNTIDGSGQLRVPRPMDLRKSNDQNAGKESKFIGQLSPLPSGSDNFNFNGNSLPPPSPGFYGNRFDLHPPPSPGLLSTNSAWSELGKLHSRRSSYGDFSMDSMGNRTCADTMSNVSSSLSQYLHDLVRAFSSRTEKIKETTVQPPTPSSLSEYDAFSDANSAISNPEDLQRTHRINSFIPGEFAQPEHTETENNRYYMDWGCCKSRAPKFCRWLKFPNILEPQSKLYMCWLALVTACFMYNAWAIPLRGVFPYQTKDNISYWLACDYFCDLIYLLDILVFKPRVTFLNHGITETDIRLTRKYYWKKSMFKFDFLSLLPLDLFYLLTGVVPWLRLPRVLKIQTFWEFYERCDQAVRSAHILRIIKTMTYMLFLIHVETCGYYAVSVYEGIGTNRWVYSGEGIAYIRCFYLATKTATSIGNNPHPTNTLEYIFMTVYWVSGVFVFALLIGQIRDIAEAAGRVKALYNKRMDAALWYVKSLNLPKETQDKVRTWFVYNWQQQKIIDEKQLMDTLPKNLRTDLAIQVHFNTLSKVKLFQDCDKSLLLDLVLKLKAILYLPGDFVCRKGEVGKEMYIVSQGLVEVLGGPDNSVVLATLKEGSVFGEISLLALGGEGNRRTADVRCKGFTNLFVLLKEDFEAAMSEYPEAHKHMKKRAKKLLRQNARLKKISDDTTATSKVEEIIKQSVHTETPKMVKTVIQVLNPESQVGKKLRAKSYDSNMVEHGTLPNMSLPHIKIKSESDMEETSASNKEEITPTENKLELKKPKRSQSLPMPTDQEVEDFFDEILAVEVIPSSDFDELQAQELKRQLSLEDHHEPMTEVKKSILKRDDTLQTENSEESADSGVQVFKATSPTESSSKTTSNQDSKESFLSNDTADVFKDTKSWVANQNKELELSKTDEYLNRIFEESLDLDKEIQELKDVLEETEPAVSKAKEENSPKKVEEQISTLNENAQIPSKNEDGEISQNNKEVIQEPNRSNTIVITPAKDDNVLVLKPEPQKKISDLSPTVNDISRKRQRALSIFSDDSSDFGKGETLIDFIANDVRENNGNVKGQPHEVKANGIPPSNQITCSVEVHREKSITPASITEWLDVGMSQNNNMRKRKESVVTPPTDLKYYESSV